MSKPIKRGEVYWTRVRVPADLVKRLKGTKTSVPVGGVSRSVKYSDFIATTLGTTDWQEAKLRHTEVLAAVQKHWDQARRGPRPLDFKTTMSVAGEIRKAWIDAFDANPNSVAMWEGVQEADRRAAEGLLDRSLNGLMVATEETRREALEVRYGPVTDAFLAHENVCTDMKSRERLIGEVAKAMAETALVNLKKAGGDYSDSGETERYPEFEPQSATEDNRSDTSGAVRLTFDAVALCL